MGYKLTMKNIQQAWNDEKPEKVCSLAEQALVDFPERDMDLRLELAVALMDTEQLEKLERVLREGLAGGVWYPKEYFESVQDALALQDVFNEWDKMRAQANKSSSPVMKLLPPKNQSAKPAPLLLALHGWGEDLEMFAEHFNVDAFQQKGFVVYVQSSQQVGCKQYVWDDQSVFQQDMEQVFIQLQNETIDWEDVTVAGFSQGASRALELATNAEFHPKRVIALCPGETEGAISACMEQWKKNGITVHILTGEKDHELPYQKRLVQQLETCGVRCSMKVFEGLGHWFPETLTSELDRRLIEV